MSFSGKTNPEVNSNNRQPWVTCHRWEMERRTFPLPPLPVTRPPLNPVSGKKNWLTLSSFLSCHRMFTITYYIFFEKNSETCLAFIFRRLKANFKLSKCCKTGLVTAATQSEKLRKPMRTHSKTNILPKARENANNKMQFVEVLTVWEDSASFLD